MTLAQQVIQLLSESPGNLVYHLVTLFAAQGVMGMALWAWRRNRQDDVARRLALAGAGIVLSRVILIAVVAGLSSTNDPGLSLSLLPPLDQALITVTAILVTWALLPAFPRFPRSSDAAVLIALLLTGILYAFFAPAWFGDVAAGLADQGYNSSPQATVWSAFQLLILAGGLLLLLRAPRQDQALRLLTQLTLLLAHFAHLWNFPERLPSSSEIPYWLRLGQLLALPLLAVFTLRYLLGQLVAAQMANRPRAEQMAESLRLSTPVLHSLEPNSIYRESVHLAAQLTGATFAALALASSENPRHLRVISDGRREGSRLVSWELNLEDWPSFRLALEKGDTVELVPDGLGARQLHTLYQELGVADAGPLLIEPLKRDGRELGVLLLAGPRQQPHWPGNEKALAPYLAAYLAEVLGNARAYQEALSREAAFPASVAPEDAGSSGRLLALEHERDKALQELAENKARWQQTEVRYQALQQQLGQNASRADQQARMAALEEARDNALAQVKELTKRLEEAEEKARAEQQNAPLSGATDESLAARLALLESENAEVRARLAQEEERNSQLLEELSALEVNSMVVQMGSMAAGQAPVAFTDLDQSGRITALEEEVQTLRQALIEAEEAMALASAGEGGLSTEWVMTTITRYSGELEEAQERIQRLEAELAQTSARQTNQMVTSLVQELRTPMTSISGFTELLLNETVGLLVAKQRDFLQRVKGNIERMGTLLDQIVQVAAASEPAMPAANGPADVRETIEAAINAIITQVREKDLRLNLDLSQPLPPIPASRDALYQITLHLLNNACHASDSHSQISVRAHADRFPGANGGDAGFLHLAVEDSGGGIPAEDRARVFEPRVEAGNPLITGLGDTGIGLAMARSLVTANGGRIWVDSEPKRGSTFTVLLPISPNGNHGHEGADDSG